MSGTTLVLNMEPGADCTREVVAQLSPQLATVAHRSVAEATSLATALEEQDWNAILCCKNGSREDNTPYSFLDSLPGMACQLWLDKQGVLHFPYVSEGCSDLLGLAPLELERQPQSWLDMLHPDDAASFHQSMRLSATHATPWNWEGRIVLSHGEHAQNDKSSHARLPLPNLPPHAGEGAPSPQSSDETTSHSTKHDKAVQVAGYPANGRGSEEEIKWVNLRAKHHKTSSQGTLWKGFMVNITQNKQAEIEIKQSRQRLRELSSHIETIKEEERTRIAREIHDEIGMLLTALKMDLSWVAQRLPPDDSALQEKIQDMNNLLDTAGKTANELVHSLRPGFLDCFGIVAAIEIEAREFTKRTGIPCKISKSRGVLDISDEQSITLFRVFQETLNNIMKHAAAQQVQVQIHNNKKCLELIVSDDGQGFDESARSKPRSFGLRGIQERIGQLGGKVKITSKPGTGTQIAVRLPIEKNV